MQTKGFTPNAALNLRVQEAITEIDLPSSGNLAEITASSNTIASFMQYRSGVSMSQSNKDLLRDKENLAWSQNKRISKGILASILSEMASDTLRGLTDSERDSAIEALRGYNHTNLPSVVDRSTATLRANGTGRMTPTELSNQINAIRGTNVDTKINQGLIELGISNEIDYYIELLSEADSSFFDNTKGDMTPMQAVLISYAVVTNDTLSDNQASLTTVMSDWETHMAQEIGSYPSHVGEKAFGLNGYFYSTPTDLLMTEGAIGRLIRAIAVRGNL